MASTDSTTKRQRRAKRLIEVRTASKVAAHLNVSRKNGILFRAVATKLGKEWTGGKHVGYALVMEYARRHDIKLTRKPRPLTDDEILAVSKVGPSHRAAWRKANADDFLASYEWRKLRMEVIKERGARCECCGASPKDDHTVINVDHIKPRRIYPELALEKSNLQVLCHECNHGKGNWDTTDWRATESDKATEQARQLIASVPVLDMVDTVQ